MKDEIRKRGRPKGIPKTGGRQKGDGTPKYGGRKKGTPNKSSLSLAEALADIGFSAAEVIMDAIEEVPAPLKLEFMTKLLPYLHPQRKAIDPDGYVSTEQVLAMQTKYFELLSAALTQKAPQQAQDVLDEFRHSLSAHAIASQNGSSR